MGQRGSSKATKQYISFYFSGHHSDGGDGTEKIWTENVVLFKEDISGYFQLCVFVYSVVHLMASVVHNTNDPNKHDINGSTYMSTLSNFG